MQGLEPHGGWIVGMNDHVAFGTVALGTKLAARRAAENSRGLRDRQIGELQFDRREMVPAGSVATLAANSVVGDKRLDPRARAAVGGMAMNARVQFVGGERQAEVIGGVLQPVRWPIVTSQSAPSL